ncbi:MAG TPA: AAA family ATPase [Anaerolineae bacterium]|nr:AAA family ATPase [Anaerolineae bacterium]
MRVVCSGSSGSDRMGYLEGVQQMAHEAGIQLEVRNVGDMMLQKASNIGSPVSREKILDLPSSSLEWLRGSVFEELVREVATHDNTIIATHTCFRWKKFLSPAFDTYYLQQLNPDFYVTIIDDYDNIRCRLEQMVQWRGRLELWEILVWRDEEALITKILAQNFRKPHYLIARQEPPDILFNLMFRPERQKAYLSYPITAIEKEQPEQLDRVREFLAELREYLTVFNPLAMSELERARDLVHDKDEEMTPDLIRILEDQTVARDYKFIDQSDFVVVYYPVKEPSPGVLSELIYGFSHDKEVYMVFPYEISPFLQFYCTEIFKTGAELIDHLKKTGIITTEATDTPKSPPADASVDEEGC